VSADGWRGAAGAATPFTRALNGILSGAVVVVAPPAALLATLPILDTSTASDTFALALALVPAAVCGSQIECSESVKGIVDAVPEAARCGDLDMDADAAAREIFAGAHFNAGSLYQVIKPSGTEMEYNVAPQGLKSTLRPFQVQSAHCCCCLTVV
jgi:hypothetical protein